MLLKPHDATGDVFPMEDFLICCKDGLFTDDDGIGYYSTSTHRTDFIIRPSHTSNGIILKAVISNEDVRYEFTHVTWYNR